MGWILAQQGWFERALSAAVRASRTDGSALPWLATLSFVYGVLHAAGPGHGKAVLAAYMVANRRALRRGIALSFLAALLQAAVAVGAGGPAVVRVPGDRRRHARRCSPDRDGGATSAWRRSACG